MTPLRVHLSLGIMFLSIEPGRWESFVSSSTDSKCKNMVDGCHLSLVEGRRGHLTLDSRGKNLEERGGSVVFRNTDFMVQKLGKTWAVEIFLNHSEFL